MSSIEPCEEDETQLYIRNSVEVQSNEICAESVLSVDDVMQGSKAATTVDGNPSLHTVVSNQKDNSTVASSIQLHHQSHSRRHSSNQKSYCAIASANAAGFQHKSQSTSYRSDPEADAGNKLTRSVQNGVSNNSAGLPLKQNDVLKSSPLV